MTKNKLQLCAFCSKQKSDVNILITGHTGNICDTCVAQANNIIREELQLKSSSNIKQDLQLLKPSEIKAHLDKYIIGQ